MSGPRRWRSTRSWPVWSARRPPWPRSRRSGRRRHRALPLRGPHRRRRGGRRHSPTSGGRVDLLLHAAGLEISRNLPDKEPREFDLVFDVKVDGLAQPLGRAGRRARSARRSRSARWPDGSATTARPTTPRPTTCCARASPRCAAPGPGPAALALDWTAWGGIGMATRGSIPKIMEMAGVQMLPPEAGVAWIRRELASGPFSGEVIVAGELGLMAAEYHPTRRSRATRRLRRRRWSAQARLSVHDGLVVTVTPRPHAAALPRPPPHRRDTGAARGDGDGGLRRGRRAAGPGGLSPSGRSRTSRSSRR